MLSFFLEILEFHSTWNRQDFDAENLFPGLFDKALHFIIGFVVTFVCDIDALGGSFHV